MVEHLCEMGEVEIVYTMDEREAKTENETLVDDILAIMTHFTARVSGNKARKALKVIMDHESLKEAYHLHKAGYSFRHIAKEFEKQGRTDDKGRKYTRAVVRQNLLDNLATLEATSTDQQEQQTSFERFVKERIRKASEKVKVSHKRVIQVYEEWRESQGIIPLTLPKIPRSAHRSGLVSFFQRACDHLIY